VFTYFSLFCLSGKVDRREKVGQNNFDRFSERGFIDHRVFSVIDLANQFNGVTVHFQCFQKTFLTI